VAAGSVKTVQQNGVDVPSAEWAAIEQQQTTYTRQVEAWVRKHRVPETDLEVAQATLACHRRIENHLGMLVHLKRYEVSSHTFPILPSYPSHNLPTPFPLPFAFPNANFSQLDLEAVEDEDSEDDSEGGGGGTGSGDDDDEDEDDDDNGDEE
jgi:hypothetical protein